MLIRDIAFTLKDGRQALLRCPKEEDIEGITLTLARVAFEASRQGVNIFKPLEYTVFPLEASEPDDIIAGAKGHLIDVEANAKALRDFLYGD